MIPYITYIELVNIKSVLFLVFFFFLGSPFRVNWGEKRKKKKEKEKEKENRSMYVVCASADP